MDTASAITVDSVTPTSPMDQTNSALSPVCMQASTDSGLPSANTTALDDHPASTPHDGEEDDESYTSFDATTQLSAQLHDTTLSKPKASLAVPALLKGHAMVTQANNVWTFSQSFPQDCVDRVIAAATAPLQKASQATIAIESTSDDVATVACSGQLRSVQHAALLVRLRCVLNTASEAALAELTKALNEYQPFYQRRLSSADVTRFESGHFFKSIHALANCQLDVVPSDNDDGTATLLMMGTHAQLGYSQQLVEAVRLSTQDGGTNGRLYDLMVPSKDRPEPTLRLHVLDDHIGRIMGKQGAIIGSLQKKHNVIINIPKRQIAGTRSREFWIQGLHIQLEACLSDILRLLNPDGSPTAPYLVLPPNWPTFPMEDRPNLGQAHRASASPRLPRSAATALTPAASRRQPRSPHHATHNVRQQLQYSGRDSPHLYSLQVNPQFRPTMIPSPISPIHCSPFSSTVRAASPVAFAPNPHHAYAYPPFGYSVPLVVRNQRVTQVQWQQWVGNGWLSSVQQCCQVELEALATGLLTDGVVYVDYCIKGYQHNVMEAARLLTSVPVGQPSIAFSQTSVPFGQPPVPMDQSQHATSSSQ
eukprot:m.150906 g.150906  ORF g.150906 m.150906 type:complete len:591 (-) comp16326_c0_seq1:868-2640(-)